MRRKLKQAQELHPSANEAAHSARLREAAQHLQRAKNVLHVPFSQAMKAIAFLCAGVSKAVWAAERKARRVVSREYAVLVLREMAACRPPPPFELQEPHIIASIAFDQTYAKAAGKTGISAYSAVQTVDAQGNPVDRERMTYINGQHFPVPLAAVPLTPADIALILSATFLCVIPLILHLIGDGQSCLRLRNLKRKHPWEYKHVLIGNGHMHSGAHSTFADLFLWWSCLLCMCMVTIGKVVRNADGTLRGTVLPTIKSLERNSAEHAQQGLLPVAIAIIVYFTTTVTSPPPELFLSVLLFRIGLIL